MPVETPYEIQLAYIPEVTFKTTPATPTGEILRFVTSTLAADRSFLKNPEKRTDRQNAPGRGGVMVGKGDISGVMSAGTYDDLLEAALGGTWTTNVLKVGNARKSFTFERLHKVNGFSFPFLGVVVDGFTLAGTADQNVTATFNLIAAKCGTESAATIWTATTPANTNPVLTSWTGSVKKGGVAIGTVTAWTLKGANNYSEPKVVGSQDLYDLQPNTISITGTLELWFDSYALYTDFRAENSIALEINIGDGVSQSYTADLTDCRITKFGAPVEDNGLMKISVEFESFTDATNTACKFTRIP